MAGRWAVVAAPGRPGRLRGPRSCVHAVFMFFYHSAAITLTFFLKIIKRASHSETMFEERRLSPCPREKTVE